CGQSPGTTPCGVGRLVRSPETQVDLYDLLRRGSTGTTFRGATSSHTPPLQHCASRGRPRGCRLPAQSSSTSCRCPTVFHISSLAVASWRIAIAEAYSASANILVVLCRQLGIGIHFVIAVPMAPHRKIANATMNQKHVSVFSDHGWWCCII
ncbi:unnamed protein product, partial [Musa acuminata subsp. burmannicoides]